MRRRQKTQITLDEVLGKQEMIRLHALVRIRVGVARIENEKLVQQRCASTPVADDENRLMPDFRSSDPPAINQPLHPFQDRVAETDEGHDDRDVPILPMDGEAISHQQAKPGKKIATFPDSRMPLPFFRRRMGSGRRWFVR